MCENIQPEPNAGNPATGATRGKTYEHCEARKIKQPLLSAEKHTTGAKHGRNLQSVISRGKRTTGAKRGKTCNKYQGRDNMQPVQRTEKYASGSKGEKTRHR